MLKRHRQSPPPFPTPDTSLISDFWPDNPKRQRVLPPTLDGGLRGWSIQPQPYNSMDDEDVDEEKDTTQDIIDESNRLYGHSQEYKAANTMLYELHALHQHRLMFLHHPTKPLNQTDPSRSLPPSSIFEIPVQSSLSMDKDAVVPSERRQAPPWIDHQYVKPILRSYTAEPGHIINKMTQDEVQRVKDRYKHTNRYLGSLFLSRRRELSSLDESYHDR